jgi:hypothetical protein
VPAVQVSGVVDGPAAAFPKIILRLVPTGLEDLGLAAETATALVGPDGSFDFMNVPRGDYLIDAPVSINEFRVPGSAVEFSYGSRPTRLPGLAVDSDSTIGDAASPGFSRTVLGGSWWARQKLAVGDTDLIDVRILLRPMLRLEGRVIAETHPNKPAPRASPNAVSVETATGSVWNGRFSAVSTGRNSSSEFRLDVVPGRYLFRPSGTDWLLKSVMVNGRDHLDEPLDLSDQDSVYGIVITLTNAGAGLSGTVNARGNTGPVRSAVILFPRESTLWSNYGLTPRRVFAVRTATDGSYQIRNIPAGDYHVLAVPDDRLHGWRESGFFERFSQRSERITLGWAEEKSLNLSLLDARQ